MSERVTHLRVTARPASGFRRAGRHWPAEQVDVPVDQLTDAQVTQLKAEPNLIVQEIEAKAESSGKAAGNKKGETAQGDGK